MDMTNIGVGFVPFETRTGVIARLATQADEAGLASVGVAEGWTYDSTILLAELAQKTSRIGLGASVLSVWGRSPATIALAATGLQRCSGGRFTLGIGAGSPPLTEGLHGRQWERPIARVRETLTAVRALLGGERLPNPAPGGRPLRIGAVPDAPVPIELAALSSASIRLAGELADAWTPFLWARSRLDDGRELLSEGEARAESPSPTRVAVGVPVALAPDEQGARRLAASWLAAYTTRMGPLYPKMLAERFGMGAAVEAIVDAAAADREPDLPAAAEVLAREVTLMGTYDEAPELVAQWFGAGAGADSLGLVLPPGRPEEELAEIVAVASAL
jgi:alkanesulfonate monooxygenase SsuD/methylene tetrahydromethanopterin reductase-like flavin-dependent oxidoreductase (luciferase family)